MACRDDVELIRAEHWPQIQGLCGHCDRPTNFAAVATSLPIVQTAGGRRYGKKRFVCVCYYCQAMSILVGDDDLIPAPRPGKSIEGLKPEVQAA